jgi:type I restriction enzyme, S subunit
MIIKQQEYKSWSLVSLEDLAVSEKGSIRRGPFGGSLKKEIFVNDGYLVYEQQHAIADDFSLGRYFIDEVKYKEMEGFNVLPDDLIISCAGTIGKIAIAPDDSRPGIINQALMRIRPDRDKVLPIYLKRYLESPIAQREIFSKSSGSALKNLVAISEIKKSKIPLPSLEEQKRIVAILDKADRVRRKRQEAIRLTEELGRSIFLDMFGDPVTNPKGWEIVRLESLLNFMTSGSRGWAKYYAEKGKIFLRIQNVKNGRLILEDVAFVNPPDNAEGTRTKVKEGDVLVSITADLGRTAVIPKDMIEAYINQHLVILRVNQDRLSPVYLSSFLSSEGGRKQFSQLDREGVKSGLNFSDLKGLSIIFPPIEQQRKYEEIYDRQIDQLLKQKGALEESENLFNSLLQRAFRGEL